MSLESIGRCGLFASLTPEEIDFVLTQIQVTETTFRKGEILAHQNEPCNRLIILISGSVKAEMSDPSGRVIKVEDISAPNPLAILFLFGRQNRFPVQATAREEVSALVIPKPSVLRMLGMNQTLLENYLDISAEFASRLSRKLHFMSFRTIRQKMAMYLCDLARFSGSDTIRLDRTKSALAEYFGVSRPSLEREITRMQRDGLIAADRKEISILDRAALSRLIHF